MSNLFFTLATLLTLSLWVLGKETNALIITTPLVMLSQITALMGLQLFSTSLFLGAKIPWLESVFGGYDRQNKSHRMIGSLALLLLLNHPILLAVNQLPHWTGSLLYLLAGKVLSYNLGIWALWVLIIGVLSMVLLKLPFETWKLFHRLLGISFLLGAAHGFLVSSDLSRFWPLSLWVGMHVSLGLAGLVYIFIWQPLTESRYDYVVTSVQRALDVVNIFLKPASKPLSFYPGQFAYLTIGSGHGFNESHPFSIASAPGEKLLRVSAKIVGDFTASLPQTKQGDTVHLSRAFGRFGTINAPVEQRYFIAGGIGITPFLSMLRQELLDQTKVPITLFYCVSTLEEAVFDSELKTIAGLMPWFRYRLWVSRDKGRLSGDEITLDKPESTGVWLCGPESMMEALADSLEHLGIPRENIRFESFSWKV